MSHSKGTFCAEELSPERALEQSQFVDYRDVPRCGCRGRFVAIALRDGLQCHYCYARHTALEVGHLIHRWFGGTCDDLNLRLYCSVCTARRKRAVHIIGRRRWISLHCVGTLAGDAMRLLRIEEMRSLRFQSWIPDPERSAFYEMPKGAGGGGMAMWEWQQIVVFQNGRCNACGIVAELTMDHIVAQNCGGSHNRTNFQGLCQSCNSAKGDRVWTDFLQRRGFVQQFDLEALWSQEC